MNRLSTCNSVHFTHMSHIIQTQIVVKRCFDYWVVKLIHARKQGNSGGEVFDPVVHKVKANWTALYFPPSIIPAFVNITNTIFFKLLKTKNTNTIFQRDKFQGS